MTVAHLLSSADPRRSGGIGVAVARLAAAQRSQGLMVQLCPTDAGDQRQAAVAAGAAVVHSHGLWLASSRAARRLRRSGLPLVVTPHGMLDPWAARRRGLPKALLWWWGERRTLATAGCLQALCRPEADVLQALGLPVPVALIPNGVDLPDRRVPLPPPPWHGRLPSEARVLLFLGRFHAKKGLEPLLQAWKRWTVEAGIRDAWLVLAGFGDGGALERRLQRRPLPQVLLVGAVAGPVRDSCYGHADGFVLPSHSEGLPMAALEAMAWGLPCLLSPGCHLPEAFQVEAAWPAPPDPPALMAVLQRWYGLSPAAAAAMGAAGRRYVEHHHGWDRVARQTLELYAWLQGQADRPAWVCGPSPP
jgi:glycosyltransferase involved in cell wall biosynthesis